MATQVGVRELRDHASEILRRVAERGESFEISNHKRVIARLVPVEPIDIRAAWDDWSRQADILAAEISADWQGSRDAVEAVREDRRRTYYGD